MRLGKTYGGPSTEGSPFHWTSSFGLLVQLADVVEKAAG